MTAKRYRKLLRAHFTTYYMQHPDTLHGWIAKAYKAVQHTTAKNYEVAYKAIMAALPINPAQ